MEKSIYKVDEFMEDYQVKTPVVMMVFNRPENTKKVFEQVQKVKPKQLFVIADGPRKENKKDIEMCKKTREIFEKVDWKCEVYKNFSQENLGCAKRGYTGFSWVFENTEQAIILEDDCMPHISFFRYCDELLEKYKNDTRIMLISGTNQLGKWEKSKYSYHFSKFGGIWGWASWKRAWDYYDFNIKLWDDKNIKKLLKDKFNFFQYISRKSIYDDIYKKQAKFSSWAYQWGFARIIQSGLAISPSVNLITNIGAGENATNTKTKSKVSNLPLYNMEFPLKHPPYIICDNEYDKKMYNKISGSNYRITKNYLSRKLRNFKER